MMALSFVVITISDRSSKGEREDLSGPTLIKVIQESGWEVGCAKIIPDEFDIIKETLIYFCDNGPTDIILTSGGTGFSPRDITPEATNAVIDRHAPGLAEAMRMQSLIITPHAMLSRAVTGIRKNTLIINLPGSPKAALENFNIILPVLPHALNLLKSRNISDLDHQNVSLSF